MQKNPRGRPRVSDQQRKTKNFTFRGTVDLHEKLRVAALRSGQSVSDEITNRLEASFDPDRDIEKIFSSTTVFALVRIIATAMQWAGQHAIFLKTKSAEDTKMWFRDAYAFDQARKSAVVALEACCPAGDRSASSAFEDAATTFFAKSVGATTAESLLREIALLESPGSRADRLRRDLDDQMLATIQSKYGDSNDL